MIRDGFGGLYEWCRKCGSLVKLNKHVFGSLHVCEPEPYVPTITAREHRRRIKAKDRSIRSAQKHCCCTSIGDPGYYDTDGELIPCTIHMSGSVHE